MDIVLMPVSGGTNRLEKIYEHAFSDSVELFVLSAYLRDWPIKTKLSKECKELLIIAGTDFGLTRKKTCREVMKWLPCSKKNSFFVATKISGFHPKMVVWKDNNGGCHVIVGSSNLTKAAFSTNHEANIVETISNDQYVEIKKWIYSIKEKSEEVSEEWLETYSEAEYWPSLIKKGSLESIRLSNTTDIIKERRAAQKSFDDISSKLFCLIKKSAEKKIENDSFYTEMMNIWGRHSCRFQYIGFERTCKNTDWHEVASSLLKIVKSKQMDRVERDDLVIQEINRLVKLKNPARGSWLSEMLCHFFPDDYPLLNAPVKGWLKSKGCKTPRGRSEGDKYLDITRALRSALKNSPKCPAKNLAELDRLLWDLAEKNLKNMHGRKQKGKK